MRSLRINQCPFKIDIYFLVFLTNVYASLAYTIDSDRPAADEEHMFSSSTQNLGGQLLQKPC